MRFTLWIAVLLSLAPAQGQATEQQDTWSFEDHPHPSLSEMTLPHQLSLLSVKKRNRGSDIACRASLQAEYEIYLDLYPGYFAAFDERERFKQWKLHMAQNPAVQDLTCLYGRIEFRLSELNASDKIGDDFLFCNDHFTRSPQSPEERELVRLMDELFTYANLGSQGGALALAGVSAYSKILEISFDIDYYFLSLARLKNPSKQLSRSIKARAPAITPERRAFLEEAAKDRNYDRVLATLAPCKPLRKTGEIR